MNQRKLQQRKNATRNKKLVAMASRKSGGDITAVEGADRQSVQVAGPAQVRNPLGQGRRLLIRSALAEGLFQK